MSKGVKQVNLISSEFKPSTTSRIIIRGREIEIKDVMVDIFDIDYFIDNPRINYLLSKYPPDKINSKVVEEVLKDMPSIKDLIWDIEENGGLLDPIIVYQDKVIEGNRRLFSFRRLFSRNQVNKWRYIPSKVIDSFLDESDIFAILSNFHIKGKKSWDPYEKAACIKKMAESVKDNKIVAKEVGSSEKKVEQVIKAYKAMTEYYLPHTREIDKYETAEELKKYSYFEALYSNIELAEKAEKTPAFISEFSNWVRENRIPKAQDVRKLDKIISHKKARKVFLENDAEEAYQDAIEILEWDKPSSINMFYKKVSLFRELIGNQSINQIKEEINDNPHKRECIRKCFKDFNKFCSELEIVSKKASF